MPPFVLKAVNRFWGAMSVASDPAFGQTEVNIDAIQNGAGARFE